MMLFKWKKCAAGALAALIMLTGSMSFADGLDTVYIDLMLKALENQPKEERVSFGSLLKVTFYDQETLEVTKTNYQTQLTQSQKEFMAANGITTDVVIKNLEALKTWSFADRMALVDASVNLSKNGMLMLNNKYATTVNGGSVFTPTEEVKGTLLPDGISIVKPSIGLKQSFKDMTTHWSGSYVTLLTRANVITGYPDGTYRPEVTLSKAEVITMLVKAFSKDFRSLKPEILPIDVKPTDWHYDFMTYGSYLKLFALQGDLALPNEPLTREKTANIMANMAMALKLNPEGGTSLTFTDINHLSKTTQEDLLWLTKMGIFSGYPDGTFRPNQVVTRAEASVLVIKMMQLFYGSFE
jgi:hypothetical protein